MSPDVKEAALAAEELGDRGRRFAELDGLFKRAPETLPETCFVAIVSSHHQVINIHREDGARLAMDPEARMNLLSNPTEARQDAGQMLVPQFNAPDSGWPYSASFSRHTGSRNRPCHATKPSGKSNARGRTGRRIDSRLQICLRRIADFRCEASHRLHRRGRLRDLLVEFPCGVPTRRLDGVPHEHAASFVRAVGGGLEDLGMFLAHDGEDAPDASLADLRRLPPCIRKPSARPRPAARAEW